MSGCAGTKTETVLNPVDVPIVHPRMPAPIHARDVKWIVLNEEELRKLLKKGEEEDRELVLFAVNVRNYENLSTNFYQLRRYIKQLRAVVDFYRDTYSNKESDQE